MASGDAALFSEKESEGERERVWRGSSKSDERLPPASVNIK